MRLRRIGSLIGAAALAAAGLFTVGVIENPATANAGVVTGPTVAGTIKAQPNVNVRSGPGTGYTATRTVPYGQQFTVLCYAKGTTVSGWGGTNPYWDLLRDPANSSRALGYVADVWVDTRGDITRQVPSCDSGGSTTGGASALAGTVKAQPNVTVRSGAGTGYSALGTAAAGQRFTVSCYASGTTVSGWGGTNPYWDRVSFNGRTGYIADVWLDTGGDVTRQAPSCGGGSTGGTPYPNTLAGCTDWPMNKFLQVPWTRQANGGSGVAYQQGSYFGQGYHTGCNAAGSMNQQYALDFTLNQGDLVLAPGGAGRVVYAGPATGGWATCGNTVVVDHGSGWWSVVCHLSHVDVATGAQIGDNTVIGKVGGTGGFEPHLHFSLMHNAHIDMAHGGVYGGQSAKPHHMFHLGEGRGYYENFTHNMRMSY